jgi:hypothetical protein
MSSNDQSDDLTLVSGRDFVAKCGVRRCGEEVYVACPGCNVFNCFAHRDSTCVEHNHALHPFDTAQQQRPVLAPASTSRTVNRMKKLQEIVKPPIGASTSGLPSKVPTPRPIGHPDRAPITVLVDHGNDDSGSDLDWKHCSEANSSDDSSSSSSDSEAQPKRLKTLVGSLAELDDCEGTPSPAAEVADCEGTPSPAAEVVDPEPDENMAPTLRKKKRARTTKDRTLHDMEQHSMKHPPCRGQSCRWHCCDIMPSEERHQLWGQFWSMPVDQRRLWLRSVFCRGPVAANTVAKEDSKKLRTSQIKWLLPAGSDGVVHQFCKGFVLTTLGWNAKSDKAVLNALKGDGIAPPVDQRGRHVPGNRVDHEAIQAHIERFHPMEPHYRIAHAPNRRYLTSDVNITLMHSLFVQDHFKVALETYRKEVVGKNIGFTQLGSEECEHCTAHTNHLKEPGHLDDECAICADWEAHRIRYIRARQEYRSDADREWKKDELVVSADLMKVMVLPILPEKEAIFTPRLVVYNETFAVLIPKPELEIERDSKRTVAVLWHEAIAGRDGPDIASTYFTFLMRNRHFQNVTIYADNCFAQNKQWALFSMLLRVVNCDLIAAKKISLKFLEAGHTYMSADSHHHRVSRTIKRLKRVEDFSDFVIAVQSAKENVHEMGILTSEIGNLISAATN